MSEVFRIEKRNNYTIMSNRHLQDDILEWRYVTENYQNTVTY